MSKNKKKPERTTVDIRRVAEAAGVSITTVSHALSGKGRVNEETRRRVVEIARDLGYRANPLAKGLASGAHGVLGLQISSPNDDHASLQAGIGYFVELTNAAAAEALNRGYWLALAPPLDHRSMTGSPRLDGAVIVDPVIEDEFVDLLIEEDIPFVTTGRSPDRATTPYWVDNDHIAATTEVLDHLHSGGARRLAVISSPPVHSYTIDAVHAYERWCAEKGFEPVVEVVDHTTEEAGFAAASSLFEQAEPDAIYTTLDQLAIGVLRAAKHRGIDVPDGLQVACLTETQAARMATPPLTTVDLRAGDIGKAAISMLIAAIEGRGEEYEHQIVSTEIIKRGSTRG